MKLQILACYRLLISVVFVISAVVWLPASAGDQAVIQGPSTTVKFAELDLNTDAGRRELLDRLSKAARRVCTQDAFFHGDVGYPQIYGSCYDRTLAAAVDKIHHQQLSALFVATSRPNRR